MNTDRIAEMLEEAIRKYQNRSLEAAQVITELIELAKQMRAAQKRGERLRLTDDEVAFYDALEVNDSAVKVLGDETLRLIARELVEAVRRSVTIDWTVRENARASIWLAADRCVLPGPAVGSRHAFSVEQPGYHSWTSARREQRKNAAHHDGLGRID